MNFSVPPSSCPTTKHRDPMAFVLNYINTFERFWLCLLYLHFDLWRYKCLILFHTFFIHTHNRVLKFWIDHRLQCSKFCHWMSIKKKINMIFNFGRWDLDFFVISHKHLNQSIPNFRKQLKNTPRSSTTSWFWASTCTNRLHVCIISEFEIRSRLSFQSGWLKV